MTMLRKISRKSLVIIIAVIIIILGAVSLPLIYLMSDKLSESSRVDANVLLVEGWLPNYAIEMAHDEFVKNNYSLIVTTGLKNTDYYPMFSGGYLIFYPREKTKRQDQIENHLIEIDAFAQLNDTNLAHFNVYINDSLVAGFFAGIKRKNYEFSWRGKLSDIDSLLVNYDNDNVNEYGDRNLFIREIIFDKKTELSYLNNSEYDLGELDGKMRIDNDYSSYAELARNRLLSLGIDSSLVLAVSGNRVRINRTLTSALAFRDWLETSKYEIKGINIVTLGAHAKRTFMTYNNILDNKYKIGIISLPDYKNTHSRKNKVLKTLREILGIVYYRIILTLY
jgi:hypothetical protein